MNKETLQLYIDGSYRAKYNRGSYGVLAVTKDSKSVIASGVQMDVSNNIMELTAMITALECVRDYNLDTHYDVEIFCDSEYVLNGLQKWSPDWIRRGWLTSSGHNVKNLELWKKLVAVSKEVQVKLTWVKGHAGTALHNEIDKIVAKLSES